MSSTLTPPKERVRKGSGSRTGDSWRVIVLNDNHNSFEGVAFALAQTIPGVDYDKGMALANKIDSTGQAIVWPGHREPAALHHHTPRPPGLRRPRRNGLAADARAPAPGTHPRWLGPCSS